MKITTKTAFAPYHLMLIGCHDCLFPNLVGARTLYFENVDASTAFLRKCIGTFECAWLFSTATNMPLGFYLDKQISLKTYHYVPNIYYSKMNRKGEFVWCTKVLFDELAEIIDNH